MIFDYFFGIPKWMYHIIRCLIIKEDTYDTFANPKVCHIMKWIEIVGYTYSISVVTLPS